LRKTKRVIIPTSIVAKDNFNELSL
jgi:hypothetical protein